VPGSNLRLTYEHATRTVLAEAQLSERPFGIKCVSEDRIAAYVHISCHWRAGPWEQAVNAGADQWIRWTTIDCACVSPASP
jgi:hypothetical protein